MRCNNCGKELPDNLRFCTSCGTEIKRTNNNQLSGKNNLEKEGQSSSMNKGKYLIPAIVVVLIGISTLVMWKDSHVNVRQVTEEEIIEDNAVTESINESQNIVTGVSGNEADSWKQAYINLVDSLDDKMTYCLFNLNDDVVPELCIISMDDYSKSLFTFYNGEVCELEQISGEYSTIAYIPQENFIASCYVNDYEWDDCGYILDSEQLELSADKTFEVGNRILTDSVFLLGGETKTSIVTCIQEGKLYSLNENERLINEFLLGNIEAVNHFIGFKLHITDGFDEGYLEELLHPAYYLDVDNDDDKELILYDLYGTKYIDSMDGTVVLFEPESPSSKLSFVEYEGAIWIVECDLSHAGRENRVFRKYNGIYNI